VADNEHPQRRDLEPRSTPPNPPVDPEQYRQFEQFQQFQQYLKYQEAQGGGPIAQLPPGRKPPLWKKILFSKVTRKLAYLLVVILVLTWLYNHYFGGPADDGLGVQGAQGPGQVTDPGRLSDTPSGAITALYQDAASGINPAFSANACTLLFSQEGKAAFVRDFGAADCESLMRQLDGKVGALRLPPRIDTTGKSVVSISSCQDLQLKPGTMALGKFTLARQTDGWWITGHEPEPDPCPVSTTTSAPSATSRTSSAPPTSN
jgi:hypothetical protein